MRSIDYKKWADFIYSISKELKKKNLFSLELACGNGSIAKKLNNKFQYFCISDLSLSMLKEADENIDRICCNMTQLPFKRKFDFVFSTFDSVNYLTSKQRIKSLLLEVNNVLSDDGIFTFDVGLENNSKLYQRYLNRKGNVNGISFIQKSHYDETKRIHYNYFEIILANGQKVEEIHKQKIYPFEEYFDIIDESDFYVYKCKNAFSDNNANAQSERAQFILKKRQKRC